eukprot:scaffold21590_cov48-Phaeocystis_antarctica.AAC.1
MNCVNTYTIENKSIGGDRGVSLVGSAPVYGAPTYPPPRSVCARDCSAYHTPARPAAYAAKPRTAYAASGPKTATQPRLAASVDMRSERTRAAAFSSASGGGRSRAAICAASSRSISSARSSTSSSASGGRTSSAGGLTCRPRAVASPVRSPLARTWSGVGLG